MAVLQDAQPAIRHAEPATRFTKAVHYRHDDALTRVSWDEFERLIASHYRSQGYVVEHVGRRGGRRRTDGGVDLRLYRGAETFVLHGKHWVAQQVPHAEVYQSVGTMHEVGARGAIVITTGEFTSSAIEAGDRFPGVTLIDGFALRAMLGRVREPSRFRGPMDEFTWSRAERPASSRAPVVAAVAAGVVMGALLCALYGVYIHEIEQAQMAALRVTPQAGAVAMENVAVRDLPSHGSPPRSGENLR